MIAVSLLSFGDRLGKKHYVTVILRLVLNGPPSPDASLEYGEVVDSDGVPHSRFASWSGLLSSVQDFLATRPAKEE